MNLNRTQRVSKVRREWTETPTKRKNESPERDFEKTLQENAPLWNMWYFKIPDVVPIKRGGFIPVARKRFCDGVLVTPHQNYLIECKINYAKQKEHQKLAEQEINKINQSYYLIRKIRYKAVRVMFHIEQNGEKIFKTGDIQKIFKFFKNPQEYISQEIMKKGLDKPKRKFKRRVIG